MSKMMLVSLLVSVAFWRYPAATQVRYPNELEQLRVYAQYLEPLIPGTSTSSEVKQVLTVTHDRWDAEWRISPSFSCVADAKTCSHGGATSETLFMIELHPLHRVPMGGVRFSNAFKKIYGSVSEINIQCDVYGDQTGLQYWIVAKDSSYGKKGDLYQIVYGFSKWETALNELSVPDLLGFG
jgi:hypothetical protein